MREHWQCVYEDTRRTLKREEWPVMRASTIEGYQRLQGRGAGRMVARREYERRF